MDERLEKALEFSNYIVTLENQKNLIKEKFEQNLTLYYQGGTFSITESRINFIHTLLTLGKASFVVTDDVGIPVNIEDLQEFFTEILDAYEGALSTYKQDYDNLKVKRSIAKLVDLDD